MSLLNTFLILIAAVGAVFLESACDTLRGWLGTQIDLLPGLMVYASLSAGVTALTLLAIVGGLCFDSLSANPIGVSVLPLFGVGLAIERFRHLILREQPYAQWLLGLGASAAVPALTLLLLITLGANPMVGFGSLWQWLVLSLGGAAATPLYFWLFNRVERSLSYRPFRQSSFRPDREIERGRY